MSERNYKIDNFKAILIFLVVLGHLLRINLENDIIKIIYIFIYLFHMPAFMFISGYLSKFNIKKNLCTVLWPYLMFQIYAYFFHKYFLFNEVEFTLHKPLYSLWFLLSLFIMRLTIPLLEKIKTKKLFYQILFFLVIITFSLLAGFIPFENLEFSLIRILFFYPFFVIGFWSKTSKINIYNKNSIIFSIFIIIGVFITYISNLSIIHNKWLYEAYPYYLYEGHWSFSLYHLIAAFAFIFLFYRLIPNKNIKGFSFIGKNTLQVYVIHGFIIKLIEGLFSSYLESLSFIQCFLICLMSCIIIVYILSLNIFKKILRPLFYFPL